MKSHILLLIIVMSCSISSCRKEFAKSRDIVVYFYTSDFETSVGISCDKIQKDMENADTDSVIYVDNLIFQNISKALTECHPINRKQALDCRICVYYNEKYLFLSHHFYDKAINSDSNLIYINPRAIYDMKCAINYFSNFSREDLHYDSSILKYGIPANYSYKTNEQKEMIEDISPYLKRVEDPVTYTKKNTKKIILRMKD